MSPADRSRDRTDNEQGRTSRAEDASPSTLLFDRATDARERAAWAFEVSNLLSSPMGRHVPDDVVVLALLPGDPIGAWMHDIQSNDRTVIVTKAPPDHPRVTQPAPIILESIPRKSDATTPEAESLASNEWCTMRPSDCAEHLAATALDGCRHFRWGTADANLRFDVRVLFPLERERS